MIKPPYYSIFDATPLALLLLVRLLRSPEAPIRKTLDVAAAAALVAGRHTGIINYLANLQEHSHRLATGLVARQQSDASAMFFWLCGWAYKLHE